MLSRNAILAVFLLTLCFSVKSSAKTEETLGLSEACAAAVDEKSCLDLSWQKECYWRDGQCKVHTERVELTQRGQSIYRLGVGIAVAGSLLAGAGLVTMMKRGLGLRPLIVAGLGSVLIGADYLVGAGTVVTGSLLAGVGLVSMMIRGLSLPPFIAAGLGSVLMCSGVLVDKEAWKLYSEAYWLGPARDVPAPTILDANEMGYKPDLLLFDKTVTTKLTLAKRPGKRPLVVLLHGSDGSFGMMENPRFSERGYHTLGINYFYNAERYPGPHHLAKIKLENIVEAVKKHVEANRDVIDEEKIGLYGTSKGGELTLLLASLYPQFKFAIANVPSHVVMQDLDFDTSLIKHGSSWSLNGEELPFVPFPYSQETIRCFVTYKLAGWNKPFVWGGEKPESMRCRELHEEAFSNNEAAEKASIKVENIKGPVILTSGTRDQCWPSDISSDIVMRRLDRNDFAYPRFHMRIDGDHFTFERQHAALLLDGVDAMVYYLESGERDLFEQWSKRASAVVTPSQLNEHDEL